MMITRMLCSPAAVVLAIAACAAGAPMQVSRENIELDNAAYPQPELAEALARTYEAIGVPAPHHLDPVNGPHRTQQAHKSLDSLSRPAFDENRRFGQHAIQNGPYKQDFNRDPMRNRLQMEALSKRNFDEIDRTNFDSFVKRKYNYPRWEFDEIDLSGLDNFAGY